MLVYVNHVNRHGLGTVLFMFMGSNPVWSDHAGWRLPNSPDPLHCPHATEFYEALPAVARDNIISGGPFV